MANTQKWTDTLPADVYQRLAECHTIKADLEWLVAARWRWLQANKPDDGFVKEDALVYILELLDCNGRTWVCDLTRDDYDALKA